MRNIAAVVAGYVIFAVTAALLFAISGQNPHGPASAQFIALTILYGMVFAALGGFVAARIGTARWKPAAAVGVVIVVGAATSMLTAPGTEARWSQWSAIVFMAPAAIAAGWLAARRA